MRKTRSLILILVMLSSFCAMQFEPGKAKVQAETLKLGAVGPLAITPGIDMKKGADLAVKEINADGGITVGGTTYTIELTTKTSSAPASGLPDAATGKSSAVDLIDDGVVAMIGCFRTEVALAIQPEINNTIPFVSVGTTAPLYTDWWFRAAPSNGTQLVRSLLDFYYLGMRTQLNITKISIVREALAWTGPMAAALAASLGGMGLTKIDEVEIAEDATLDSVKTTLAPLKDTEAQALMTIFSGPAGMHITEAWAALDMPQYLAGINVEAQASTYFDETEGAAYGEIQLESCPSDIEQTVKTKPFRDAYLAEYDEMPTYTAFGSYDAIYVIVDAIERAGSIDPAEIKDALVTTDYVGSAYKVKFTSETVTNPDTGKNNTGHDLFTPGTVGVLGAPYTQGYYAQWQQGGVKKTIWTRPGETVATRNISKHIEWPIDHAEHGWEESEEEAPGFELPLVLLALGNLALIAHVRKRKKR